MTNSEFEHEFEEILRSILRSPDNLASPPELRQQVVVAWRAFQAADKDGSNTISVDEVQELANRLGLPISEDAETAMLELDTDLSGVIEPVEFMRWWMERVSLNPNVEQQQQIIAEHSFKQFDKDGSGAIDSSEFKDLLALIGLPMGEDEAQQAIRQLDVDMSGQIDKNEFVAWWTRKTSAMREDQPLTRKLRQIADKGRRMFNTDIHTAAYQGNLPLVRQFLEAGTPADLEDTTEFGGGYRPLHYAAYAGHATVCSLLLKHNAGVNKPNAAGCTALFLAAQQQRWAVCRLLLDHGADPTISDPTHRVCAADVCEHTEIMTSIRAHHLFREPTNFPEITAAAINSPHAVVRVVFQLDNKSSGPGLPRRAWVVRICHTSNDDQPEDTVATLATVRVPFEEDSDRITVKSDEIVEWFRTNVLKEPARPSTKSDAKSSSSATTRPSATRRPAKSAAPKIPTGHKRPASKQSDAAPKKIDNGESDEAGGNDDGGSRQASGEMPAAEAKLEAVEQPPASAEEKEAAQEAATSSSSSKKEGEEPPVLPAVVPLVVSIAIANAAGVGPWSNAVQLKLVASKRPPTAAADKSDEGSVSSTSSSKRQGEVNRSTKR